MNSGVPANASAPQPQLGLTILIADELRREQADEHVTTGVRDPAFLAYDTP